MSDRDTETKEVKKTNAVEGSRLVLSITNVLFLGGILFSMGEKNKELGVLRNTAEQIKADFDKQSSRLQMVESLIAVHTERISNAEKRLEADIQRLLEGIREVKTAISGRNLRERTSVVTEDKPIS